MAGAAILFADIIIAVCVFLMTKLARWHWLVPPGSMRPLTHAGLPYFIASFGFAWVLFVVDAVLTGQLFWGRGTGASDRQTGPIGFWLGVIFQACLAVNLMSLGIGLKLHLIK